MECRICYSSKNYFYNKLISPCKCKGSMLHIHQFCLYNYFPDKYCTICETKFKTHIFFIFDTLKFVFYQFCILTFQYILFINNNSFLFTKIFTFVFILLETIIVFKRLYDILLIFRNNLLLLCVSYQTMKTVLLLYTIFTCSCDVSYYILTVISYIQLNTLLYLYINKSILF